MTLRGILSTIALLVVAASHAAANQILTLSGRVVDASSGNAVAGATVTIGGTTGAVRTDSDGTFKWERPPTPPFHVIVILPGGQVASPQSHLEGIEHEIGAEMVGKLPADDHP